MEMPYRAMLKGIFDEHFRNCDVFFYVCELGYHFPDVI